MQDFANGGEGQAGAAAALVARGLWATGRILAAVLLLVGCQEPVSPSEQPGTYRTLVQVAASEVRVREDSTALWLRNTEVARMRDVMDAARVQYVSYDATDGVVCAWRGRGLGGATGYAFRLPESTVPRDSLGRMCYTKGGCSVTPETDAWTRFVCE